MTSTEVAIVMPAMLIVILFVFQIALVLAREAGRRCRRRRGGRRRPGRGCHCRRRLQPAPNTILGQAGNLRNAAVSVTRDPATGLVTATVTGQSTVDHPVRVVERAQATAQAPIEEFRPVAAP